MFRSEIALQTDSQHVVTVKKMDQKKPRVTLDDVALAVGMSVSAVSRTFTPGASVGKQSRAKILAAAAELGYRPNAIARTLSTKRSRIVALVVSYLQNQFYPTILERISRLLQIHGFHVLLFVNEENVSHENETDDLILEIMGYQVDGIILASSLLSSKLAQYCLDSDTPVVMFNRVSVLKGVSTVASQNHEGGQLAAQTLLASKPKRVGFIAGLEKSSTSLEREKGFIDGLKHAGKSLFAREVGHYDYEKAASATREMFSSRQTRPDALFVANDHMAFGVLDVLRNELKLSVPNDVQVIGFDNVPQAGMGGYSLSTIEQDSGLMSQAAVSTLLQQIKSGAEAKPEHIRVPVRLVLRKTTKSGL